MSVQTHLGNESTRSRLVTWLRRVAMSGKLALALTMAAILSGVATYATITGVASPLQPDPETILILLNVDLVILLMLGALVAWRLVRLWIARRQGSVGSRLHTRMVALFSVVAVAPAILVSVFSAGFFNFGLQTWFNETVKSALDRSLVVAEAYLQDHRDFIRADLLSMITAINRVGPQLLENPSQFSSMLDTMALEKGLSGAIVFRSDGRVLARTQLSFVLEYDPLRNQALVQAADGEIVIMTNDASDRVRALAQIDSIVGAFLYVGRFVDSSVITHVSGVKRQVEEYRRLESERSGIQITFTLIYVIVALLMLLASVWVGLVFANRLVRPISQLVGAAERVRSGDLAVRVEEGPDDDEIASLSRAFNRMTDRLGSQQSELIEANRQLDERRRFTEAVLFGVSAGVLGLDAEGRIFLPNRSALDLLSCNHEDLVGRPIGACVPEFTQLFDLARTNGDAMAQDQISVARGDRARTLLVRITVESGSDQVTGYVVTFDDITELVNAQRASAWSDVARRIAHEIKNPLTPIQLSAERLKRKYLEHLNADPAVFVACVDTIVRQVGGIRGMVDEFSAFARMPAPIRVPANLNEIALEAVTLQRMARPEIRFEFEPSPDISEVYCDARQVGQAITNLLQNAVDSINGRDEGDQPLDPGRVNVTVEVAQKGAGLGCAVVVQDNGRGLPSGHKERLTEPYVTTRTKGTGLGLAIVKKIMEDHGGGLELKDGSHGGARVRLHFPSDIPAEQPLAQVRELAEKPSPDLAVVSSNE